MSGQKIWTKLCILLKNIFNKENTYEKILIGTLLVERNKIAVWCKTEEEAKDFCKQSHEHGYDWSGGNSRENVTCWAIYKTQTCYIDDGYCDKSWFEKYKYNILEWSDYMDKLTKSESDSKTTFTKSDLKDGDVVLRRNGWVEIAIPSVGVLVTKDGHDSF